MYDEQKDCGFDKPVNNIIHGGLILRSVANKGRKEVLLQHLNKGFFQRMEI